MKSNLEELINSSKQRLDKEIIKTKLMELKNEINQLKSTYDALESQLKSLKKDNMEKEAKLKELLLESKKIEQDFARVSENRLAQTMNLIKHDEEIFLIQEEIKKMSEMIEQKSKILNQGFLPNKDSLFLEVVKGFGVVFVEKDEKKILIKNGTKKNIESLFLEENDVEKTREKIWELI